MYGHILPQEDHIQVFRERAEGICKSEDLTSKPKLPRQSEQPTLSFHYDCLFCGLLCDTKKDPKHPGTWHTAYVCSESE